MSITLNEVRVRLSAFSAQWKGAARENADAKLFWARFYECFGIQPESATIYERQVAKLGGAKGFIDSFIPGKLIVEHKSKGKDLDKAFDQAAEYFLALPSGERPRYIITSDFARFRLYDLRQEGFHECTLKGLAAKADWFKFLLDDDAGPILEESPINRDAAYAISKLHEGLLAVKFGGHDLEVFLTRLLFCLFADHTGIFGEDGQFRKIVQRTRKDGKDVGSTLLELFEVLNTPWNQRQSTLDEDLAAFAYVNGSLFAEHTRTPAFNSDLRQSLLDCAVLSWRNISPAIFGAMFQGVLEAHSPDERRQTTRRELGAHYTSERNILRALEPLCTDDLKAELHAARNNKPRLQILYESLSRLTFLDPACGCGNFLVIAYRELRRVENEVIALLFNKGGQTKGLFDVTTLSRVRVSQFYGIEIDESAGHIARVALWITDHQMNLETAERFGTSRPTVPLIDSPSIRIGNALNVDWAEVLPPELCSYILGNPPFIGKHLQTEEQHAGMAPLVDPIPGGGVLDYVAGWYLKAVRYMQKGSNVRTAFVSTNSITQGEQVAVLWGPLLAWGTKIEFAHRTFQWSNEGKGNAAVHCVIIGFTLAESRSCRLFDYPGGIRGEPRETSARQINPYLVDAANVLVQKRSTPLGPVPPMVFGSKPTDGGHLLLAPDEMEDLIEHEPLAEQWIRPFLGSEEFINGQKRYCLWLAGATPAQLRQMPLVMKRVQAVKAMRLASKKAPTRQAASTPYLFGEIRQPKSDRYLLVPGVSSERREFVPIGFESGVTVASNLVSTIADATLFHFAVMNSTFHNAWLRAVGGRLKNDYRYSGMLVYNTFPWPRNISEKMTDALEQTARAILAARSEHPTSSLADLYDPLTMPIALRKAHQANDAAVDAAHGYRKGQGDTARVAFLLGLYQELIKAPTRGRKVKRISKSA